MFNTIPGVDEMRKYCLEHLLDGYGFKAKEIQPYREFIRFDVLGINRLKREIRIIEIKSCRADFTSDQKWQSYLPYCTHFTFAAPKDAITLAELPKGIGLVEFGYEEKKKGWNGETYHRLDHQYVRGCSKLQERLDDEHYISLLEGVVMRLMTENSGRNMFASIQEELREIQRGIWDIRERLEREDKANALRKTPRQAGR